MKSTYRIPFFTRKTRPNKDGLVTIAIRITIDGESIEFNPKLYVNPTIWNPIGRAEGKSKEAREINQALDNVRTDLKNHYDILFEKYGYVTPEKLRNSYLGVDIQQNTILSLFDLKVEQKKNLVGRTIRSTTLSKYSATRNRISEFIQHQYSKKDLPVKEVNFQFVSDFGTIMLTKGVSIESVSKMLGHTNNLSSG